MSPTYKLIDVSKKTFYQYKELALGNKPKRTANLKNKLDETTEKAVIDFTLKHPNCGQVKASKLLSEQGIFISANAVRSIWLKNNLENYKKRLLATETQIAKKVNPKNKNKRSKK